LSSEPTNGNARWQTYFGAATVCLIIFGAIIGLFVQITTQAVTIASLLEKNSAQKKIIASLAERVSETREKVAHMDSDLIEVESQFCASDAVRNLTHASDLRFMSLLWQKVFAQNLETGNAFYPQIGRCPGRSEAK